MEREESLSRCYKSVLYFRSLNELDASTLGSLSSALGVSVSTADEIVQPGIAKSRHRHTPATPSVEFLFLILEKKQFFFFLHLKIYVKEKKITERKVTQVAK